MHPGARNGTEHLKHLLIKHKDLSLDSENHIKTEHCGTITLLHRGDKDGSTNRYAQLTDQNQ